jgi:ADP-ribose pyrophosphatase
VEAPGVGVAGIVAENGEVLLVRRGNAPAKDLWAFPGGRVEVGESLRDALAREIAEECRLEVRVGSLVDVVEAIERTEMGVSHWVLAIFTAERLRGHPEPGDDAAAVKWVGVADLVGLPTAPGVERLAKSVLQSEP